MTGAVAPRQNESNKASAGRIHGRETSAADAGGAAGRHVNGHAVSAPEVGTVLVDLSLILFVAYAFSALARRLGQPAVVGEIVGGLVLGPTVLGALPGDPASWLFPHDIRPHLQVLAQLGVVLFMFGVGYHFEPARLRGVGGKLVVVSAASVALPFTLGAALAPTLVPLLDPDAGTRTWGLAIFLGAAMSITAFPVLARILRESWLHGTAIAQFALACAAAQDAFAWCLLAAAVVISTAAGLGALSWTVAGALIFGAVMAVVVRPGLRWLFAAKRRWAVTAGLVHPILACGLLASAWATQEIGLHAVFGAFAFGAAVPRGEIAHTGVQHRIEQAGLVLLPVFFTVTGLGVDLTALGVSGLVLMLVVIVAACAGKVAGGWGAARLAGMPPKTSVVLGVLLNTRGLTELIVLDVGLSLGVLDPGLYSAMVVMAVVTTLMTAPLLRFGVSRDALDTELVDAGKKEIGAVHEDS